MILLTMNRDCFTFIRASLGTHISRTHRVTALIRCPRWAQRHDLLYLQNVAGSDFFTWHWNSLEHASMMHYDNRHYKSQTVLSFLRCSGLIVTVSRRCRVAEVHLVLFVLVLRYISLRHLYCEVLFHISWVVCDRHICPSLQVHV